MKCTKMHCRVVPVSTCIARQNAKISYGGPLFLECVNCEQGRLAREGKLNDDDVKELIEQLRLRHGEKTYQNQKGSEMTEKDKTEVITPEVTRRCKTCGVVKPMDEFPKNKECRDGIEPSCKACRRMKKKQRIARKYGTVTSVSEAVGHGETELHPAQRTEVKGYLRAGAVSYRDAVSTANMQTKTCLIITVDLTRHEEVYRSILKIAEEEERTPDAQVRYWLRNHVLDGRGTVEGREA